MRPLHASDLASFSRCAEAYRLEKQGHPRKQLSRTAYGSVIHASLAVLERTHDIEKALDFFAYYWNPLHIDAITEPVEVWQVRDNFNTMLVQGIAALRAYHKLQPWDDVETLALEFEFMVPVEGTKDPDTGGPLLLAGTIDKLEVAMQKRMPLVQLSDFKTGNRYPYLRFNIQGTAYAYATLSPYFWVGWPEHHTEGFGEDRGEQLMQRLEGLPRRFRWIDMKKIEFGDGGFRVQKDYERLAVAMQRVADAIHHDVYPLNMSGEICKWCSQRDHCAGVGLPTDEMAYA